VTSITKTGYSSIMVEIGRRFTACRHNIAVTI